MNHSIRNIWHHAWVSLLDEMSSQEIRWLFSARQHMSLLKKRRTTMIVSRVRIIAALFAILTPLWIVVDIAAFPREVWVPLVTGRIIATIAFGTITLLAVRMRTITDADGILPVFLPAHGPLPVAWNPAGLFYRLRVPALCHAGRIVDLPADIA
jgi:hypothetical protein